MDKSIDSLRRDFIWQNLNSDVKDYVRTCDTCQRDKVSRLQPAGKLMPLSVPTRRWDTVTLDFITDLPPTRDGHDTILVFVEKLTKMVHFAPTHKSVSAEETAKLYIDTVVKHHGFQENLVSDRDARFTGHFWRRMCDLLHTNHNLSTAFHPQSDGQTERVNTVLEEYLRHYIAPNHSNWDELLPLAEYAINNAKHASTGFTPFYLNYGQHPLNPLLLSGKSGHRKTKLPASQRLTKPAVEAFVHDICHAIKLAKDALHAARDRQKAYADAHRRELTFEVGDYVLLHTKNLKIQHVGVGKLLLRYIGPFKVRRIVNEVAYALELPPNMKCHDVFHVSVLKAYRSQGTVQPPPVTFDVVSDMEYEVEQILAHRDVGRKAARREYLVKWLNYGPEHNTWEPLRNMTNCDKLVEQYWLSSAGTRQPRIRQ